MQLRASQTLWVHFCSCNSTLLSLLPALLALCVPVFQLAPSWCSPAPRCQQARGPCNRELCICTTVSAFSKDRDWSNGSVNEKKEMRLVSFTETTCLIFSCFTCCIRRPEGSNRRSPPGLASNLGLFTKTAITLLVGCPSTFAATPARASASLSFLTLPPLPILPELHPYAQRIVIQVRKLCRYYACIAATLCRTIVQVLQLGT